MSNPGLLWTIILPLIAGAIGMLLLALQRRKKLLEDYGPWLRLGALLAVCTGLLLEAVFLALTPDLASTNLFGIELSMSAPARYVLTAANVSLLCAALYYWTTAAATDELEPERGRVWVPLGLSGVSTLVACVALAADRLVAALLLFGAALVVAILALPARSLLEELIKKDETDVESKLADAEARLVAKRYTGALKHIAMAVMSAAIWIVGAMLIERYGFNLENRGLLQFGVGLLAVGLLVWAGSMPFTASWGDLVEAVPTAALVALGACAPVALISGLLLLAPIEGTLARGAAAGWLGAVGAMLAGLRALGTTGWIRRSRQDDDSAARIAGLKAATVAVAVSWAVYGVLSGSQTGAVGAILVATNVALAVPLLLVGGRWSVLIAVVSLIGLPPFGGFEGVVLVAQSAANAGGLWLGLLLLGSGLVGAGWLANRELQWTIPLDEEEKEWRQRFTDPVLLLTVVLGAAQVALFMASASRLEPLLGWADVPWLTAP